MENKHEGVVKFLLGRNDVDHNVKAMNGCTPPSLAIRERHQDMATLLLECEEANPNMKGGFGELPLSWAAARWQVEAVRLLLSRKFVDVNTSDHFGRMPLSHALENKHYALLLVLFGSHDIDGNFIPSRHGETALLTAAEGGFESIERVLIWQRGIDLNVRNVYGRTPFPLAVSCGCKAVVGQLLQ